ncbi:hypothetical protein HA402_001475 [Bradysia odoriphaga]|nr:hypothetical protein HA402_001475 [Bradysia odoriphaga]
MEHNLMPGNLSGTDSGIESNCNRTNSSQQTIPNSTDSDATSAIYTIDTNQESNPLDDLTDIDQPLSDHPQLSHQLSDCSSTFEFVDFQSPISNVDGGRSNSSTLNEQESIIDELNHQSNNHHEPIIRFSDLVETNPPDDNNKMFRRQLCDRGRLSSKEEKQRQNEEIVILESSSVSSESGSWDPVFPQRTASAVNIHKENVPGTSVLTQPVAVPRSPEQPDTIFIQNQSTTSRGACFIDASSLLDDTEVAFSSLNCPNVCESSNKLLDDVKEDSHEKDQTEVCKESEIGKMELKLESNEDDHAAVLESPNLSDEQKLFHRGSEQRTDYDIKDQFASDACNNQKIFTSPLDDGHGVYDDSSVTKETNSIADDLDADFALRQEQERKQGNFLFKNSIQHYSQTVQPVVNLHSDREESDMSLPSVYSTNSEPYNDFGHNYETSSQYSSNFGDTNEYGHAYSRCLSETESGIYPDTPHNSIVNVDSPRCFSRSDNLSQERSIKIPKKPFKCDESAPIVSGGASIADFTPKLCESPSVRRKTETCPIISGGLLMADFEDDSKPKVVEKPKVTPRNAWVVDMSDCKSKRNRSDSSSSSMTDIGSHRSTDTPPVERSGSSSSHKSGLGFYVSLNDMKPKKSDENAITKNGAHDVRKSSGFYVDLSENENSRSGTPPVTKTQSGEEADKKNIFSMFIDFGVKKVVAKKEPSSFTSRLTKAIQKQNEEQSQSDSENQKASDSDRDSDHAVVARRSCSPGTFKNDAKRHSWNTSKEKPSDNPKSYARSSSLCNDNGIMSILDKIPFISKTSSMSIDSPHSPYDEFSCSKSLSSYSNNSNSLTSNSIHSSVECKNKTEPPDIMATSTRRRQKDAKINETFDKSSQGSLTDGILSKDSSPTTDTDDVTFQNDEPIVRNHLMETIVEAKETNSPKKVPVHKPTADEIQAMEALQATIEKQKMLLETVNEEVQLSSFVKLSDMDKKFEGPKFELHGENLSKSVGSSRIGRLFIDGKTTNRNTWHSMSRSQGNNLTNLASSVENLRSLTRLFPHLSKELSNSLPIDFQIDDMVNKSPSDYQEYIQTDLSSTSSLTSSFSRSGMDSADESSLSCRQPRRLGEDLLKMFLQEIATDVIVEVNGRRMRAHKCILVSRCQYFAAILAGGWVQSAGDIISLPGYSYGSVHFALCHIYSGASHPPEGISLMELAALADLLGLEGLKEVTAHALRTNYCHNFHKPCSGCIEGILQVFPVTLNHGLDDLYRKCLRWTCKHYVKVWPTRAFAQLPPDIINRCRQHIVAHLSSETVLNVILDCDNLLTLLAPCRWAIAVENTVRDIIDTAHSYIADHFASLIASDGFLSLGHGQSWNISRLENLLLRIGSTLTADQACRSYQRITRLSVVLGGKALKMTPSGCQINNESMLDQDEMDWNPEFLRLVTEILRAVEQCLTRQCSRAMRNNQWQRMDLDLRKKIQKLACLSDPIENKRLRAVNKPVTYSNSSPVHSRNQDLYQLKLSIQAHSKRTAQEQHQQYRPSAHSHTQTHVLERHIQERNLLTNHDKSADRVMNMPSKSTSRAHVPDLISTIRKPENQRPVSLGHRRSQSETINTKTAKTERLTNVRPRYLEPKTTHSKLSSNLAVKAISHSSSDSSRNASPSNRHHAPVKKQQNKENDSTNMSRDSLASPAKVNKLTKNRSSHDIDRSIDSLGESMLSSIKTEKTLSQESIIIKRKDNLTKPALKSISRSNPMINKQSTTTNATTTKMRPLSNKFIAKPRPLSGQTTNENSPSSVTTKSSRLSSLSSPRDVHKTLSQQAVPVKKSFLSAKSKEILAKKQQLNHTDSTRSVPAAVRAEKIAVNKSQSTSNVPHSKPNPFNTTLHLRRTAKLD